jgi:hypothetical protein
MTIIHGMNEKALLRVAAAALRERLQVMPAVVVSGARQAGKSTLVQEQVEGQRIYATLDASMDATWHVAIPWRSSAAGPSPPFESLFAFSAALNRL